MYISYIISIFCILLWESISYGQNPKISEIRNFCQKTLHEIEYPSSDTSPSVTILGEKEVSTRLENMILQEEQAVRKCYQEQKLYKKWAKEERSHAEHLVQIGLFGDAIIYLKEIAIRPQGATGIAYFLLAHIYQKRGNQTQAKVAQQKGAELLKEARSKKGHKPQWLIQQAEQLQRDFIQKSGTYTTNHKNYVAAYKFVLSHPEDNEAWKKLIQISDNMEYRIETLCFLSASWKLWGEKAEPKDKGWILYQMARLYSATSQANKSLETFHFLQKEGLLDETYAPEALYYGACAYIDLRRYEDAESYLRELENKYPNFYHDRSWLIRKIQEELVNRD